MIKRFVCGTILVGLSACVAPPPPQVVYAAPPVVVAPPPPGPVMMPPRPESLADRLAEDEQRIQEGVGFGQFTSPEYNELQGRHAAIERDRRGRLAQFGGRIPPGIYQALLAREMALSRTIYDYRHNGATPTAH